MKLTKEKLQKIVKEELENLVNEEDAIDYAKRQEGYEKKIFKMLVKNNMTKDPAKIKKLRRNKEMMAHLVKVVTRPDLPINKKDPDFATKAKDSFIDAFDNVVRNLESGKYSKKTDVPPVSDEDSLKSMAKAFERDPKRFTRRT
jgi:hypothetical protein